jgi:hypothetical protein
VKKNLSEEKFKRNDKSREVVSILTASMSGPTVEKCKAKVDLAKKLPSYCLSVLIFQGNTKNCI